MKLFYAYTIFCNEKVLHYSNLYNKMQNRGIFTSNLRLFGPPYMFVVHLVKPLPISSDYLIGLFLYFKQF